MFSRNALLRPGVVLNVWTAMRSVMLLILVDDSLVWFGLKIHGLPSVETHVSAVFKVQLKWAFDFRAFAATTKA